MSEARLDWNEFWRDRNNDPLAFLDEPRCWSDVCWKVALEGWEDRFRHLAPGQRLLECGCGSATLSRYMTQRGYECTMLDHSLAGIQLAQTGFSARGLSGQFVVGDINRLGFENQSFDIVYSGGVLEFFDDIQKPIAEMTRVLRPGGLFAANMVPRKISIQSLADIERSLAHSLRRLAETRKLKGAFRMECLVPPHYYVNDAPLEDYVHACRNAGLSDVQGGYATPFPALALPGALSRIYTRFLHRNRRTWHLFNERSANWKRWVGITYTIYGIKQ